MALGAVKCQRGRQEESTCPENENQRPEVNVCVMGWIRDPLLEVGGPTAHWIRPEMLVHLTIDGRNVNTLVDSGSQVYTIMPAFM